MKLFPISSGELLFTFKTFVAAIIALWIAFFWNLPQPYWALMTVLIIAQPYTGMVRSKSLYRFIGTILGASVAVILIPNLVDYPALLTMALGCWISLCLYLSLIDGSPRSYAYILSGYTAALIGFPSVIHPEGIFGTAVARVEEVSVGILSTFIINEIFFPRSSLKLYFLRATTLLEAMRQTALAIFDDPPGAGIIAQSRSRLSIDLIGLTPLSVYASYDTANPERLHSINSLRYNLYHLLPLLSEIVRHLECISQYAPKYSLDTKTLLNEAKECLSFKNDHSFRSFSFRLSEEHKGDDSGHLILENLEIRLREFCLLMARSKVDQRSHMFHESSQEIPELVPYRDHFLAGLSSLAIFLTVLILSLFWILTEWPDGATATMMAAVATTFFASQDDPAPAIVRFMSMLTIGSMTGILFLYTLLPVAHDFLMLAILIGIVIIPVGIYLGRPQSTISVLAFSIGFAGVIALSSTYHANFKDSINASIAQTVGVYMAAIITRLVRSVGASVSVRRLYQANLTDLIHLATLDHLKIPPGFMTQLVERTHQIALRQQALPKSQKYSYGSAFLHPGVARTLYQINRETEALPPSQQENIHAFLKKYAETVKYQKPFRGKNEFPGKSERSFALFSKPEEWRNIVPLLVELEILTPNGYQNSFPMTVSRELPS